MVPSRTMLAEGVNIIRGPLFAQTILKASVAIISYSTGPGLSATKAAQDYKEQTFVLI